MKNQQLILLSKILLCSLVAFLITNRSYAQPANDNCAAAVTVTSNPTCTNTTYNIRLATNSAPTGACGGATATTTYDMWFKFVATASTHAITLSGFGSSINAATTYVEVFNGTVCGSMTSMVCQAATNRLVLNGLTIGATYYYRVYVTTNPNGSTASRYNYSMCLQGPPANDDCAGAVTLTPGTTCSNTSGSLDLSTATTGLPVGCEMPGTHYDVWYKFVAARTYELISISGLGANLSNPEIQLYSGACGSLSSLACGTTSITYTNFIVGNTYYVRVSNVGTNPAGTGTVANFSICVYHPTAATFDYGKSYANLSKITAGGTINPGDTLEIRATLVIKTLTLDSLAFYDTLSANNGLRLIPGTLALRTNEGKIYKSFTDAVDSDAGHYYTSGTDTVIRMNIGSGATGTARGRLTSTSKPSNFGTTCIIMATYRVVVYAGYGTVINMGGGAFTVKDQPTGISSTMYMSTRNTLVYNSPGLCPNAVSATNAIGGDFNGTFGTPSGPTPLLRNRGTSPNVLSYIYKTFATGQGPNDYYYGIANNTSATYQITSAFAKPDAKRVFNVWDITGDHTGASNTAKGNNPCDTTKPVSATNPCGYMLVINSAYKQDTAFQFGVTNLCPNTYYEISAWIKNICSKCSCDSNGVGASGTGYIPFAPNDSSGVQPNMAFDIDGVDYYSTGNIRHMGVTATQMGSDSTNIWVKRGFVFLTGPSQTSLTLTIRNNAPGGGGNDWAIDDISLATCLPNMNYSPTLNPTICDSFYITIRDTIRSYFDNYVYYKWQRSTDGGVTWTDVTAAMGPVTPVFVNGAYQYITSYTIPPSATNTWNNGDKYRVVVATTLGNLSDVNCQVTDGISIITLNVINCDGVLELNIMNVNARLNNDRTTVYWSVGREEESWHYIVQKSMDGSNYLDIGEVTGNFPHSQDINNYSFLDMDPVYNDAWYRIIAVDSRGAKKYSRVIKVSNSKNDFAVANIINPFSHELTFTVNAPEDSRVSVTLSDINGRMVKNKSYTILSGQNSLSIGNTESLPQGVYVLQIKYKDQVINKMVMKR